MAIIKKRSVKAVPKKTIMKRPSTKKAPQQPAPSVPVQQAPQPPMGAPAPGSNGPMMRKGGKIKKAANGITTTTVNTTKNPTNGPTYKNLGLARSASNKEEGRDTNIPATKKDSLDYKKGFNMGKAGVKPSPLRAKYEGKNQYEEKGRWEGQNTKKKSGGSIKKAQGGIMDMMGGGDKSKEKAAKAAAQTQANSNMVGNAMSNAQNLYKNRAKSGGKMKKCKGGC